MNFVKRTKRAQLEVGLRCKYIGDSRPYGALGTIVSISPNRITINWELSSGSYQQVYQGQDYTSYIWDNVLFQDKKETKMSNVQLQTVTLLTIFPSYTGQPSLVMEATAAQIHTIENTEEGKLLLAAGNILITKAIKQGNEYFALNPLTVTLPKASVGVSERPLSIT